jgi:hypothetical protein
MACTGRACDWALDVSSDFASCVTGSGTCSAAKMMTTNSLPNSHDSHLKGASSAIQGILRNLIQNHQPPGKELSFLNVGDGVMLAWVSHEGVTATDVVSGATRALDLMEATPEGAS